MKKYFIEAYTTNGNGVKITTSVYAASAMEAELAAGRKLIETGFDPKAIKIERVSEQ